MQSRKVSPKKVRGTPVASAIENKQTGLKTKSKSQKKVSDPFPTVSPSKLSNGSNDKLKSSKKARVDEGEKLKSEDSKQKSMSKEKKVAVAKKVKAESTQVVIQKENKAEAGSISPNSKFHETKSLSPKKQLSQSNMKNLSPKREEKQVQQFQLSDICEMVKPKKPLSNFMIYSNQRRSKLQNEHKDLSLTDISKLIGQEWSMISSQKLQEVNLMAEQDVQRYQREMEQYEILGYFINSNGVKSTDLTLQNPKFYDDVVQPKKPKNPYIFFLKQEIQVIKESDPSLKLTEITKLCGLKWQSMSLQELEKFQQLSERDNTRYKNELRQLLTFGYFIDSQGVKSTDYQVNQKKVANHHATQQSVKSDNSTAPTFHSLKSQQSKISGASSSSQKKKSSSKVLKNEN